MNIYRSNIFVETKILNFMFLNKGDFNYGRKHRLRSNRIDAGRT